MRFGPCTSLPKSLVAASFVAVYLLGRDLLGPKRSAAGTLLLTGIFYYSWPTPELNHNVVQMPLWAWLFLALWRATRGGCLTWWIVLGVVAGLSIWAKYSSALVLVVGAWLDGRGRARALEFRNHRTVDCAGCLCGLSRPHRSSSC